MASTKPTVDDLIGWLKLNSSPSAETLAVYDECMETAVEYIEDRINLPAGTTDDNYPRKARMAILLSAARLAKRSTSPEGVSGMNDLGVVIRIMARDPDVEMLIMKLLTVNGFA